MNDAKEQKMRVLVAYYTQTQNTEKVTQAILAEAQALENSADLTKVRGLKPEVLGGYDVVFLGSACHGSDLAKPVKKLLAKLPCSPSFRLAGFVTHATYSPEAGDEHRKIHEQWAGRCLMSFEETCKEKAISWDGCFGCQDVPSKLIEMFIHRSIVKDPREWSEYIAEVRKHPSEEDLANARAFAREALAQTG